MGIRSKFKGKCRNQWLRSLKSLVPLTLIKLHIPLLATLQRPQFKQAFLFTSPPCVPQNFFLKKLDRSSSCMVLIMSYLDDSGPSFIVVVQLLSHIWLFATPWTAAWQGLLSYTISWSLLRFMSIELVMLSNHYLILCCPLLLLPSIFAIIRVFSNELALCIRYQNIRASASVPPINIQGWYPLGLLRLISLKSKGL